MTLANAITRIRVVFKYAADNTLIPHPINFGTEFKRPKKKVLRAKRQRRQQANGKKNFEAADLRPLPEIGGAQDVTGVLLPAGTAMLPSRFP